MAINGAVGRGQISEADAVDMFENYTKNPSSGYKDFGASVKDVAGNLSGASGSRKAPEQPGGGVV